MKTRAKGRPGTRLKEIEEARSERRRSEELTSRYSTTSPSRRMTILGCKNVPRIV